MTITVEPGARFDAPASGAWDLSFASEFSTAELDEIDTTILLDVQGPDGSIGQIVGDNISTDIVFHIEADQFGPGEWILSPVVTIEGVARRFIKPMIANVIGTFTVHPEEC